MTQNNFFYRSVVVPTKRSMQEEKISQMNRRRKINEFTVWVAVASAGGTLSMPLPLAEPADLVKVWGALSHVIAMWSVIEQVAGHTLGSVLKEQEPEPQG